MSDDPRARRTRDGLKEALAKLLMEKTLTSISVLDVTRTAGVNRATFYAHFQDKNELLNHFVRDRFRLNLAEYVTAETPFDPSGLRSLIMGVRQFLFNWNKPRCRTLANQVYPMIECTTRDETFLFLEGWLPRDVLSPRQRVAEMLSWSVFGVAVRLSQETDQTAIETLAEEYMTLLDQGIFQGVPLLR